MSRETEVVAADVLVLVTRTSTVWMSVSCVYVSVVYSLYMCCTVW